MSGLRGNEMRKELENFIIESDVQLDYFDEVVNILSKMKKEY